MWEDETTESLPDKSVVKNKWTLLDFWQFYQLLIPQTDVQDELIVHSVYFGLNTESWI